MRSMLNSSWCGQVPECQMLSSRHIDLQMRNYNTLNYLNPLPPPIHRSPSRETQKMSATFPIHIPQIPLQQSTQHCLRAAIKRLKSTNQIPSSHALHTTCAGPKTTSRTRSATTSAPLTHVRRSTHLPTPPRWL